MELDASFRNMLLFARPAKGFLFNLREMKNVFLDDVRSFPQKNDLPSASFLSKKYGAFFLGFILKLSCK